MLSARDTPGGAGKIAADHRVTHRLGHRDWILATVDGTSQQYSGTSQLHGEGRIGGGADTGVDQHWDICAGTNQLDIVRIQNA